MKPSRSPRFHASTWAVHTALTSASGSPTRDCDGAHAPISISVASVADRNRLLIGFAALSPSHNESFRCTGSTAEPLMQSYSLFLPPRIRRRDERHSHRRAYRDGAAVLF